MEDVGGVGEEVGPHVGGGVPRQFGEVLRQFLFGVAPGEVGVGLLEADLGQGVHHRGAGEGLGEEDDVGVGAVDLADDPLPEDDGFGVGVVDAEDPHAVVHPVAQDADGLGDQAVEVGVEGDGVDVLVLLGRVLGVGDGAVGAVVEPLGVFVDPGVVGGALEGEVEGDLQAQACGLGDEVVEVLEGAQGGVDGVVAALGGADGPGDADVVGSGGEGVVAALAVGGADGVDGREVDDVEAHRGDRGQPAGGGAEGAVGPVGGALGTGEELVPGAVQGAFALHQQRQRVRGGDQLPQRMPGQHRVHLRRQRPRQPGRRGPVLVPQRVDGGQQDAPVRVAGHLGGGPLVEPGALLQDQPGVDARRDLDPRVVAPGGDRVAPRLHGVRPEPGFAGGDGGAPAVGARGQFAHRGPGAGPPLGVLQYDVGGDRVVPLAEHGGRDLERLSGHRFGGPASLTDDRADVQDGDASDDGGDVRDGGFARGVARGGARGSAWRLGGCAWGRSGPC